MAHRKSLRFKTLIDSGLKSIPKVLALIVLPPLHLEVTRSQSRRNLPSSILTFSMIRRKVGSISTKMEKIKALGMEASLLF